MLERTRFLLRLRRGRTIDLDDRSGLDDRAEFVVPEAPPEPPEVAEPAAPAAHRAPLAAFRGVGRRGREPQCPNCGRFHVERQRQADALDLSCPACSAQWSWRPGAPWPRTVPRPSLDEPIKE